MLINEKPPLLTPSPAHVSYEILRHSRRQTRLDLIKTTKLLRDHYVKEVGHVKCRLERMPLVPCFYDMVLEDHKPKMPSKYDL